MTKVVSQKDFNILNSLVNEYGKDLIIATINGENGSNRDEKEGVIIHNDSEYKVAIKDSYNTLISYLYTYDKLPKPIPDLLKMIWFIANKYDVSELREMDKHISLYTTDPTAFTEKMCFYSILILANRLKDIGIDFKYQETYLSVFRYYFAEMRSIKDYPNKEKDLNNILNAEFV